MRRMMCEECGHKEPAERGRSHLAVWKCNQLSNFAERGEVGSISKLPHCQTPHNASHATHDSHGREPAGHGRPHMWCTKLCGEKLGPAPRWQSTETTNMGSESRLSTTTFPEGLPSCCGIALLRGSPLPTMTCSNKRKSCLMLLHQGDPLAYEAVTLWQPVM